MTINGFIVVRLPQLNYLVQERDVLPCLDGIYYAGIDRQRWVDVFDEDYYTKKAPAELVRLASSIKTGNRDFTGIDVCQDAELAFDLLAYANRESIKNELVALRLPALDALKGTVETDLHVEWLGFDFVALGDWSLIAGGVFISPQHYSAWTARVNRFGLFDDPSLLTEYVQAYEQAVEAGHSEPIAGPEAGFQKIAIEVGRVQR